MLFIRASRIIRHPPYAEPNQVLVYPHGVINRRSDLKVGISLAGDHLHHAAAFVQVVDNRRCRHPQHMQSRVGVRRLRNHRYDHLAPMGNGVRTGLLGKMNLIYRNEVWRLVLKEAADVAW